MMNRGTTGVFNTQAVAGETWRTFIPNPLPPVPPIAWDAALQNLLQNAALALGKLESLTQFLPNPHLFLYSYVRKEALLFVPNRRHAIHLRRYYQIRSRRELRGAVRRRHRSLVLCCRDGARAASTRRRLSAFTSTTARDSRCFAQQRTWTSKATRRVPHFAKLDWRFASRKCRLCAAAS